MRRAINHDKPYQVAERRCQLRPRIFWMNMSLVSIRKIYWHPCGSGFTKVISSFHKPTAHEHELGSPKMFRQALMWNCDKVWVDTSASKPAWDNGRHNGSQIRKMMYIVRLRKRTVWKYQKQIRVSTNPFVCCPQKEDKWLEYHHLLKTWPHWVSL